MKPTVLSLSLVISILPACSMLKVSGVPGSEPEPGAQSGASDGASSAAASSAAASDGGSASSPKAKDEAGPTIDVVTRLSGFKPEDSMSLARVAEALKAVKPDMIRYAGDPKDMWIGWDPIDSATSFRGVSDRHFGQDGCKAHGFRVEAGHRRALYESVCATKESFEDVAAGTPMVVWSPDKDGLSVLVTFDGGRYIGRASDLLEKPPAGASPAPLQHTFVGRFELATIAAKADPSVKSAADGVEAPAKQYNDCNYEIYKKGEKAVESLPDSLIGSAREAKISSIWKTNADQQAQACDKHLGQLEAAMIKVIEARNAERKKIWDDTASVRGAK